MCPRSSLAMTRLSIAVKVDTITLIGFKRQYVVNKRSTCAKMYTKYTLYKDDLVCVIVVQYK